LTDYKNLGKQDEVALLRKLRFLLKSDISQSEISFDIVQIAFYFYRFYYYRFPDDIRYKKMAITAISLVKKHGTDKMIRDIRSKLGSLAVDLHGSGAEDAVMNAFDAFVAGMPY
jgi:hypothetical protein